MTTEQVQTILGKPPGNHTAKPLLIRIGADGASEKVNGPLSSFLWNFDDGTGVVTCDSEKKVLDKIWFEREPQHPIQKIQDFLRKIGL